MNTIFEKRSSDLSDVFAGFSKLNQEERWEKLKSSGLLNQDEVEYLRSGGLKDTKLGEKFIENVIGYFQLPMGIATHFRIDGRDYCIPMAVEETSIVAAASKTAKWVKEKGEIFTRVIGQEIIGQIQFPKVYNFREFKQKCESQFDSLIRLANIEVASGMVSRGGGVTSMEVRQLKRPDGEDMAVIHVYMNPCDAMGANIINQVCEYLKSPLEDLTGEKIGICILSNLVDRKLTEATVFLREIEPDLAEKIEEASLFAQLDPFRAATNNKGVLNGIDPVLVATGNDWRAVEAGIHAYAVQDGNYSSITKWKREGRGLLGTFRAPLVVGTVGGVTSLHPTASLALRLLGTPKADELSRVIGAVGLVQNLGALKALTTVGIIEGHMKLHIKNLSLGAGAQESEVPELSLRLERILIQKKRVSMSHAIEALRELRSGAFK